MKFIDSLNFFPMPLSAFPKTFGLMELKKGFLPHFFNTVQNQIYAGYVPDKKYYDPDGMSPQRKEEFLRWHTEKVSSGYIFDFQDELLAYCQSDVRLLKEGCEKFQKEFKDICGFNPMKNCITIASACNTAYPRNWMPENKIAIKPVRGWRPTHTNPMQHSNGWRGRSMNSHHQTRSSLVLLMPVTKGNDAFLMATKRIWWMDLIKRHKLSMNSKDVFFMDVLHVFPIAMPNILTIRTKL